MPHRTLEKGQAALEVSAIGLGCTGMTAVYGPPSDKQQLIALIRGAVDRGVTFFDTADAHGPFANWKLVATKFGIDIDHDTGERRGGVNSRPEHVKRVADASLRHLSVDVIEFVLSASCRPGGTD